MAVSFTSNILLAKPDETELALNWARGTQLADDNNNIVEDETEVNYTSYAATVICNTTNPVVGAGFIHAQYQQRGKYVFGNVSILFLDPGVVAGTGTGGYGISLPFVADNVFHTVATALTDVPGIASGIGEGHIVDSSTVANNMNCALDVATIGGVSYARIVTETFVGKTNGLFIPTQPFTIATNDRISIQYVYKVP